MGDLHQHLVNSCFLSRFTCIFATFFVFCWSDHRFIITFAWWAILWFADDWLFCRLGLKLVYCVAFSDAALFVWRDFRLCPIVNFFNLLFFSICLIILHPLILLARFFIFVRSLVWALLSHHVLTLLLVSVLLMTRGTIGLTLIVVSLGELFVRALVLHLSLIFASVPTACEKPFSVTRLSRIVIIVNTHLCVWITLFFLSFLHAIIHLLRVFITIFLILDNDLMSACIWRLLVFIRLIYTVSWLAWLLLLLSSRSLFALSSLAWGIKGGCR